MFEFWTYCCIKTVCHVLLMTKVWIFDIVGYLTLLYCFDLGYILKFHVHQPHISKTCITDAYRDRSARGSIQGIERISTKEWFSADEPNDKVEDLGTADNFVTGFMS